MKLDNNVPLNLYTIRQYEQKVFDSLFSVAKVIGNKDISQKSKDIFIHTCCSIYDTIQKEKKEKTC